MADSPRALELLHRAAVAQGCTVGLVGWRKGLSGLETGQVVTMLEVRETGKMSVWSLRDLRGRQLMVRPRSGRPVEQLSVDQAAERLLFALGAVGGEDDGA